METTGGKVGDQLTLESIMDRLRHQLESDTESGVIGRCSDDDLTRVVTESVQALWGESRIKTYIPVLAMRRAREEIRALGSAPIAPR